MIDRKYVVSRDGRDIVRYAGLLDAAHKSGIDTILTTMIQAPAAENEFTAIFKAAVRTGPRTFEAHGDANFANTHKAMAPAIIRIAETRAKARALRDLLNAGELEIDDTPDQETPEPPTPPTPPQIPQPNQELTMSDEDFSNQPITDRQIKAIFARTKALGMGRPDEEKLRTWTAGRASAWLEANPNP